MVIQNHAFRLSFQSNSETKYHNAIQHWPALVVSIPDGSRLRLRSVRLPQR
jgi:hypothetical protein